MAIPSSMAAWTTATATVGDGLGRGEDHAGAHSLGSRDNAPQPQARVEEGVVALSDLIAHTVILKGLNRDAGGDQGLSPRP